MPKPLVANPRNEARRATCLRAYKYVCAGCDASVYMDGGDQRKDDKLMRSRGWSLNTEAGWLCRQCAPYGSPFARLGPRARRRLPAITSLEEKRRRAPLIERLAAGRL